jgi:hypothetical protein
MRSNVSSQSHSMLRMRRALRRQVLRALERLPVAGLPKEKTALGTLASVRRRPPRLAGGILPHIGVTSGQPHPYSARERNHGRSSTARTRASVAESTRLSTITRRPHLTTISIRPGNDGKLIVEVVASSPSKSRPSRAHNVNNWLTDGLYRRAVAETCRRPAWLSATSAASLPTSNGAGYPSRSPRGEKPSN